MKRLNWILGSLLGMLLVAVIVAVFCNPGLHYRVFHDEASMNAVMSRLVKPGDSVAHVTSLLGNGHQVSETERQQCVRVFRKHCQRAPELFPDGVQDDDEVLKYRVKGFSVMIGHRDGKLVNFNWEHFDYHLLNP